jgi:hypothetical protein
MRSLLTRSRVAVRWAVLALASLGAAPGCGSGSGSGDQQPFTFLWFGTVTEIVDGNLMPAAMAGVQVGDAIVARVDYDPALFADGLVVDDGREYAAPAGLVMTYEFSSGGRFTRDVTGVSLRDPGAFDQVNWLGSDLGGLLFQLNDPSDTGLSLPFEIQFSIVHAEFADAAANFASNGTNLDFPAGDADTDRRISMDATSFQLISN